MRVIGISWLRNEEDIVETFVRYHASMLDLHIIVLHRSTDASETIVRALAEEGLPLIIRQDEGLEHRQPEVLTGLMREAARDWDADWILPLDADEFLAGDGDPRATIARCPPDRVTKIPWVTFVPTPADDPQERNIVRRITHQRREKSPRSKILIPRALATEQTHVMPGSHFLHWSGSDTLCPAEPQTDLWLGHFPVRSWEQLRKKILLGWLSETARKHHDGREGIHWKEFFRQCSLESHVSRATLQRIAMSYACEDSKGQVALSKEPFPLTATTDCDPRLSLFQADVAREEGLMVLLCDEAEHLAERSREATLLRDATLHELSEEHTMTTQLQEHVFEMEQSIAQLQAEARVLHKQAGHLQHTRSWRWTKPMRWMEQAVQSMVQRTHQPHGTAAGAGSVLAIIPTAGNDVARLERCLRALHRAAHGVLLRTVVVVSPDDGQRAHRLRLALGNLATFIERSGPFNLCGSYNLGLAQRRNEGHVLLLNDDCFFVDEGDLTRLAATGRRERFACVGPWVCHMNDDGVPLGPSRATGTHTLTTPVPGMCMLWDAAWIARIGPFDERFGEGYGCDEADYCLRARRLGARWGRDDDIVVLHHNHATFGTATAFVHSPLHRKNLETWDRKYPGVHPWGAGDAWAPTAGNVPLVICMATYNPDMRLFRKQIASIRTQTFTDWICIVQDDRSDDDLFRQMQELLAGDPRFRVERNTRNVGFYHNFERALVCVPEDATYVAFADQDDVWYPEKLARCLAEFDPATQLVYCDMRIVDASGRVLSETFWRTPGDNNWTDFATLFIANSVTGAASVFRRSLLSSALPFPPRDGDSFHDWWIACTALLSGVVRYVPVPLYDYVQHRENAFGYGGINRRRPQRSLLRQLYSLPEHYRAVYTSAMPRFSTAARALLERFPTPEPSRRTFLERMAEPSSASLLRYALTSFLRRSRARVVHRQLALGALVQPRLARAAALERELGCVTTVVGPVDIGNIEEKLRPLELSISPAEPRRVNLLLSTIDFRYLFGGYIADFQLALSLARAGYRVRLVTLDLCTETPEHIATQLQKYQGLEDLLDRVEISCQHQRTIGLRVHPDDTMVAANCWAAHVAHAACQQLTHRSFLYLIQEYEPFLHAAGSYYVTALESYRLPHRAIFSSPMLQQFFQTRRIGSPAAMHYRHAITVPSPSRGQLLRPGRRRLLFYCRPESHAARNMFELGILALRKAIRSGVFADQAWEFLGIGAQEKGKRIVLDGTTILTVLPRMPLNDYHAFLVSCDVGLALLCSPHPGVVPLEMAAAGMSVVTNTFECKTRQDLERISPNIIAREPRFDDLEDGLRAAAERVTDIEARLCGTRLQWSRQWETSFGPDVAARLMEWMENERHTVAVPSLLTYAHDR